MEFEDFPPEICENVLLGLDVRTLLLSQLVCQRWADLIHSSSAIQQALFFKPAASKHLQERQINPLLAEQFPPWFPEDNPEACAKGFSALDMNEFFESRERYLHPNASWRRMLIQQPPATTLSWVERREFPASTSACQWTIGEDVESPGCGIRMRLLYDLILAQFWAEHRKPRFHFRVCWPHNSHGPDRLHSSPPMAVPWLPRSPRHLEQLETAVMESDVVLHAWDLHGARFPWSPARSAKNKREMQWGSLKRFLLPFEDDRSYFLIQAAVYEEGSIQRYSLNYVNIQPIPDSDESDL
jgi:hypothetical protein